MNIVEKKQLIVADWLEFGYAKFHNITLEHIEKYARIIVQESEDKFPKLSLWHCVEIADLMPNISKRFERFDIAKAIQRGIESPNVRWCSNLPSEETNTRRNRTYTKDVHRL
jgi:hypothetical protein